MKAQRLQLQQSMLGVQPELALVLEISGRLEDFVKAVENIPGLEFLEEFDQDDPELRNACINLASHAEPAKHRLFLVMTNEKALQELVRLFEGWLRNPEEKFKRGLAKWQKSIFFPDCHTILE